MKKFYIISNYLKDPDLAYAQIIKDKLDKLGAKAIVASKEEQIRPGYTNLSGIESDTECAIVLGGDGTVLRAAANLSGLHIPLVGINLGTLGFLAEIQKDQVDEALKKLVDDQFDLEERMMLEGKLLRDGKILDHFHALNDITISRNGHMQMLQIALSVNQQLLHRYQADGIIVATPTGSTGYSLSAGGPIVDPKASLMVVSAICPHSMQNRSIILSPEEEVVIEAESRGEDITFAMEATFDGSYRIPLREGDQIAISKSVKTTKLIKLYKQSFLDVLQKKMAET